jgi:hypothetical protein
MNLKSVGFDLNVKDTACGLPVDWFISDWSVDQEGTVGFDY